MEYGLKFIPWGSLRPLVNNFLRPTSNFKQINPPALGDIVYGEIIDYHG